MVALCGLPMHSEASPLAAGGRGGNGRSRSVPKTLLAHSESGIPGHVCPSAGFAASNCSVPDFIPMWNICPTLWLGHLSHMPSWIKHCDLCQITFWKTCFTPAVCCAAVGKHGSRGGKSRVERFPGRYFCFSISFFLFPFSFLLSPFFTLLLVMNQPSYFSTARKDSHCAISIMGMGFIFNKNTYKEVLAKY